jgi:protein-disulfide isomerase
MASKRVETGGRNARSVKKGRGGNQKNFVLAMAAVAVVGVGALTYLMSANRGGGATEVDPSLPPVESEGYVIGSPDAPVEVIEFADFECPACAQFAIMTGPDVKRRLVDSGIVRVRFVDFPLPGHNNSWNASRAAACADEQGQFWAMHDAIYLNQDRWASGATRNPDRVLKEAARQLPGLNTGAFDECVDSRRTQAKVQAHHAIAGQNRVNQTPTFIIGGQMVPGAIGYDQFRRAVDEAIARGRTAADTARP